MDFWLNFSWILVGFGFNWDWIFFKEICSNYGQILDDFSFDFSWILAHFQPIPLHFWRNFGLKFAQIRSQLKTLKNWSSSPKLRPIFNPISAQFRVTSFLRSSTLKKLAIFTNFDEIIVQFRYQFPFHFFLCVCWFDFGSTFGEIRMNSAPFRSTTSTDGIFDAENWVIWRHFAAVQSKRPFSTIETGQKPKPKPSKKKIKNKKQTTNNNVKMNDANKSRWWNIQMQ